MKNLSAEYWCHMFWTLTKEVEASGSVPVRPVRNSLARDELGGDPPL